MDHDTVLVLAKPTEPQLAKLAELPPETNIAVGTTPEAFERTADDATVIFSWGFSRDLLRQVVGMCPTRSVGATRSAGLGYLAVARNWSRVPRCSPTAAAFSASRWANG